MRSAPSGTSPAATASTSCRTRQDSSIYYFYEVYEDQAALEKHRTMPHYKTWQEVADVLDGPTTPTRCTTVFPADKKYWTTKR